VASFINGGASTSTVHHGEMICAWKSYSRHFRSGLDVQRYLLLVNTIRFMFPVHHVCSVMRLFYREAGQKLTLPIRWMWRLEIQIDPRHV